MIPVLKHNLQVMRRATLYMTQCKLARAWSSWWHTLAKMQYKRHLAHHAMAFLLHHTQGLALQQWKAFHTEAQQDKQNALIANTLYRQHFLRGSMSLWHKKARKQKCKQLQYEKAENFQRKRWFEQPFKAWHKLIVRLAVGRQNLVACLHKMLNGDILDVFNAWHEAITQEYARTTKLQRAMDRLLHAHQAASFNAWRDAVQWHQQKLAEVIAQHLETLEE